MSFLCHLLILQSSEIELYTTNLCHMSLVFYDFSYIFRISALKIMAQIVLNTRKIAFF